MRMLAYTRFELVRTVRNVRLLVFSLGFPLALFLAIAVPTRGEQSFAGTGISVALYYMVGLVACSNCRGGKATACGSAPRRQRMSRG